MKKTKRTGEYQRLARARGARRGEIKSIVSERAELNYSPIFRDGKRLMTVARIEQGPKPGSPRMATIAFTGSHDKILVVHDPAISIARKIRRALDPRYAPSPVRTMADMSAEEVRAIAERLRLCPPKTKTPEGGRDGEREEA